MLSDNVVLRTLTVLMLISNPAFLQVALELFGSLLRLFFCNVFSLALELRPFLALLLLHAAPFFECCSLLF